MEVKFDLT